MKITKIIAAFMVAGLIGIAGCDTAVEVPAGGPEDGGENMQMQDESDIGEDPGPDSEAPAEEPAEEPAEAPAEEAPAEEGEG